MQSFMQFLIAWFLLFTAFSLGSLSSSASDTSSSSDSPVRKDCSRPALGLFLPGGKRERCELLKTFISLSLCVSALSWLWSFAGLTAPQVLCKVKGCAALVFQAAWGRAARRNQTVAFPFSINDSGDLLTFASVQRVCVSGAELMRRNIPGISPRREQSLINRSN